MPDQWIYSRIEKVLDGLVQLVCEGCKRKQLDDACTCVATKL